MTEKEIERSSFEFRTFSFFQSAKIQKDLEKDVKYLSLFNKNEVVFVLYDPARFFKDDFVSI